MSVLMVLTSLYANWKGVRASPMPTIAPLILSSCQTVDSTDDRTTLSIIWSCISTVFLCTWVAYHPDVPKDASWSYYPTLDRVMTMLAMLIAPEIGIGMGVKDYVTACKIVKRYRSLHLENKWTLVHAHFVNMGGFALYDGDKHIRTLTWTDLESLSQKNFPKITKNEIEDRSKGDSLSKGLALLQTSWFVLQCIARAAEHLPITELEIATLGFALLNFMAYGFWWKKPLNVQCPVRIQKNPGMEIGAERTVVDEIDTGRTSINLFLSVMMAFGAVHCIAWSFHFPSHAERTMWRVCSVAVTCVPVLIVLFRHGNVVASACFVWVRDFVRSRFGIHMGWIGGEPDSVSYAPLWVAVLFYSLARVVLLVLAFTALRSLPAGAHQEVQWVTFVPHIS